MRLRGRWSIENVAGKLDLHFEGATRLNASRQDVFEHLTDPRRLVGSIPGSEGARVVGGAKVEAKVRADVTDAAGLFEIEMAIEDTKPMTSAKLVTSGKGAGSTLKVTSSFALMGDAPTWMTWTADAEVDGAITRLDHGLLKSLGDKKVEEIIGGLSRAVQGAQS